MPEQLIRSVVPLVILLGAGLSPSLAEAGVRKPTVTPKVPCFVISSPGASQLGASGPEARSCDRFRAYDTRRPAVRAIMRRMYRNDRAYRTFSALFVDRAPGDPPGSAWIDLHPPNGVRVALYADGEGSGTPYEYRVGKGSSLILYSPARNIYTETDRVLGIPQLVPLADLSPGVVQRDVGGTTFSTEGRSDLVALLADSLIHPAALVTSPLWESKRIGTVSKATYQGRPVWVLKASQLRGAVGGKGEGDGWRMWVDRTTGIVLRVVYLQGRREIGWAGMERVAVDGRGSAPAASLVRWSLPAGAQYLDGPTYALGGSSGDSGPLSWAGDHAEDVGLLVLLLVLLLVRLRIAFKG